MSAAVTIYECLWAEWETQGERTSGDVREAYQTCARQLREAHRRDNVGAEAWRARYRRALERVKRVDPRKLSDADLAQYHDDLRVEVQFVRSREADLEGMLIAAENEQARRKLY